MSGSHQAVINLSSGSHQFVIRQLSRSHQPVVRQSSGTHQIVNIFVIFVVCCIAYSKDLIFEKNQSINAIFVKLEHQRMNVITKVLCSSLFWEKKIWLLYKKIIWQMSYGFTSYNANVIIEYKLHEINLEYFLNICISPLWSYYYYL